MAKVPRVDLPLSDRALRVLAYAREEARSLNARSVGTHHLLVGLVRICDGVAKQILLSRNLDLLALREHRLLRKPKRHRYQLTDPPPSDSQVLAEVFELAQRQTQHCKHNYIGTEHLLWALTTLRSPQNKGLQVLRDNNVLKEIKADLVQFFIVPNLDLHNGQIDGEDIIQLGLPMPDLEIIVLPRNARYAGHELAAIASLIGDSIQRRYRGILIEISRTLENQVLWSSEDGGKKKKKKA